MQIREIMSKHPTCCTRETNLQDVARKMGKENCGQIPVIDNWDNEKVVGVVTDRDIVCRVVALGMNPLETTAGTCMSSPVITVTVEERLEDCCRVMEEHQVRRVPVVDERGRCCGIVAVADIVRHGPQRESSKVFTAVSQKT